MNADFYKFFICENPLDQRHLRSIKIDYAS